MLSIRLFICLIAVLLFPWLLLAGANCQLVGNRGVVGLPPGFQYHDTDTLAASRAVTR